jgi:P-type conjugative transfer protein TrbL
VFPTDIFDAYFGASQHYAALITPYAMHLLYALILLEITTIGVSWMMGSDDLPELLWRIVRLVFTGGFAWWWVTNSWNLGLIVLGSFNQLGFDLTGIPGLTPMALIRTAAHIASMIFSAPSTGRLIPDFGIALEEVLLSGLIYIIFIIIAALAIFVIIGGYIILAGSNILVAFLPNRWTTALTEGYFPWVVKTGVVIFFFYLVLGIAQSLMVRWDTTVSAICGPVAAALPSPFLGSTPTMVPAVTCSTPIPVDVLSLLLADTIVLAIICIGIPFTAGAIVQSGSHMALEHFAAAKYLAGSAVRPIGRVISTAYNAYRSTATNNQSKLQQRIAAGANAAAQVAANRQTTPLPPVNAYGVQRTQTLPQNNGAKATTTI